MSAPAIDAPDVIPAEIAHLDFRPGCETKLRTGARCSNEATLGVKKACCGGVVLLCRDCCESTTSCRCLACDIYYSNGKNMIEKVFPL